MSSRVFIWGIISVVVLGLLYFAERMSAPNFLQNVGSDLFGALVVGLGAWAFFKPSKALEAARALIRNHRDLQILAVSPKSLSPASVEQTIRRDDALEDSMSGGQKASYKTYRAKLVAVKTVCEERDPKVRSPKLKEAWNATLDPLGETLRKLNRKIGKKFEAEKHLYELTADLSDEPESAIHSVKPFELSSVTQPSGRFR